MRKMAIMLAASAALLFGAGPPWQAQAQIERGPAALADTPQNFTRLKGSHAAPIGAGGAARGITGSAVGITAGARPADDRVRGIGPPRLAMTRRGGPSAIEAASLPLKKLKRRAS